jgi:hypothetical protein
MEKCFTKFLLKYNIIGNVFNRIDIFVRLLAIEEFYGENTFGYELYKKMQIKRLKISEEYADYRLHQFKKLIKSFEINGFNKKFPIKYYSDYKLFDGSHRLACCIYFNIDEIIISKQNYICGNSYNINWFIKNDFSIEELNIIKNVATDIFNRYKICH